MPFEILQELDPLNTVIKVIGVGGGGGNAVEHMITHGAKGIEFIAANTDHQALSRSRAHVNIQLGSTGLGAGARPEVGAAAAQEKREQVAEAIRGAHLLFITAGMGGGTGTGAAPVIAEIAKEMGILTVAVVTKPFSFEGGRRMRCAEKGIENLKDKVDSMIVILNEKLESECPPNATMKECFEMSNEVLYKACVGIAEIIHTPGTINVDFEDLKTVMSARPSSVWRPPPVRTAPAWLRKRPSPVRFSKVRTSRAPAACSPTSRATSRSRLPKSRRPWRCSTPSSTRAPS